MADPVTETWQRKRMAPIVTHTCESAEVPSLEELLRELLAADQNQAAPTK